MKEIQIKTTVSYHFTPIRMAIIFFKESHSVGEDAEKLERLYTAGGNVQWCLCCGRQFGGSSKS